MTVGATTFKIGAFYACENITSIEGWPENVESMSIDVFVYTHALEGCYGLLPDDLVYTSADPNEALTYLNAKSARYKLLQLRYSVFLWVKHARREMES